MKIDINKFSFFIASTGSLNNYGSTLTSTKSALSTKDLSYLKDQADQDLFKDIQNGVNAIISTGFTVQGIIAINQQFTNGPIEAPTLPGHLRNYMYNEEDNVHMIVERSYSPNRRLLHPARNCY
ncbi:hypothetical protein [Limosilactobacillus fermentum]|uniref:hypothetical protein n=1 Tax=Limosilactobacillus fermentum TaxID=1613 RepID=UPI00186BA28C|nr:hypothetical protein [Limosilactobacillus fermentum]